MVVPGSAARSDMLAGSVRARTGPPVSEGRQPLPRAADSEDS
jgi:hypothetical protein